MIKVSGRNDKFYTVKALAESPPVNSSLTFDFIIPGQSRGYSRSGANFILADNKFNKAGFVEKIKDLGQKHKQFKNSSMNVIAMDDIYFEGGGINFKFIFTKFGNRKSINILFAIISIIFLITLLNFSNLQIININSSIKNIGINKITGAGEKHIFYQKITELVVLMTLSAILITATFVIVLPYFNKITGVELAPEKWKIFTMNFTILSLIFSAAMIYPAMVYFRISVTNSLKNQIFSWNKLAGKYLIISAQFALSFVLLIASIVVVKQLHLMLNKDLGFTSKNIIQTKFLTIPPLSNSDEEYRENENRLEKNYQYLLAELESNSSVKQFSLGQSPITPGSMPWKLLGGDKDYSDGNNLTVTPNYVSLLGLTIVEGRFFEKDRDQSRGNQIVINEAAKKFWGIEDISKARILNKYWSLGEDSERGYEIIGVVKDFNSEHLSAK
jgi:putative ABC transport system permease protein